MKQATVQKFECVFFRLLEISVFCPQKMYGAYSLRLILSNNSWKAACQVKQSNSVTCFTFAREKIKLQEAFSNHTNPKRKKYSLVPMSLKARTAVRVSNPVFKKDMLLFAKGVIQPPQ